MHVLLTVSGGQESGHCFISFSFPRPLKRLHCREHEGLWSHPNGQLEKTYGQPMQWLLAESNVLRTVEFWGLHHSLAVDEFSSLMPQSIPAASTKSLRSGSWQIIPIYFPHFWGREVQDAAPMRAPSTSSTELSCCIVMWHTREKRWKQWTHFPQGLF